MAVIRMRSVSLISPFPSHVELLRNDAYRSYLVASSLIVLARGLLLSATQPIHGQLSGSVSLINIGR